MHLSQSFSPITQTSQLGLAPAVVNRTAAANPPDKLANLIGKVRFQGQPDSMHALHGHGVGWHTVMRWIGCQRS